ncbi:hypothetical protein BOTBODRAFT_149687 [Botryobasidium botryosum FD-172 SS1]|uniref:Uncharacterized protein n=1 Tax=Botryobasidium botryosum (strain FD-172 SS1) TaxID=930990 RepID=A0A067M3I4_BOTB1|nr:hypothetical protein BOTBODRAFT_149687 [Botryobasidium botryosum FD-172 SS1]
MRVNKLHTEQEDRPNLNYDPVAQEFLKLRHDLQRTFLSRSAYPGSITTLTDLTPANDLLSLAETRAHEITIPYLQYTKIGKVARKISQLPDSDIPGDEKYSFRERAGRLVVYWQGVMTSTLPWQGDLAEAVGQLALTPESG